MTILMIIMYILAALGVVIWSAWCVMVALLWRYRWEGRR